MLIRSSKFVIDACDSFSCEAPLLTIVDTWKMQKSQETTILASEYTSQITVIYKFLYEHTHTTTATNAYTGETTVEQDSETVEQTQVEQTTMDRASAGQVSGGWTGAGRAWGEGRAYIAQGNENKEYQLKTAEGLRRKGYNGPIILEN